MYIEKRESSYRVVQMFEGKKYSVTVDHKPSKAEALILINEKISVKSFAGEKKTFENAALEYVEAKKNVLSPRSVREYKLYPARLPKWFTELPVQAINQTDVQKCINDLAKDKAPKTVKSLHGFISSVLKMFRKDLVLKTTLPQKVKKDVYIPTKEEVNRILEYTLKNNPMFYAAIYLAAHGLRREEILALELTDLSADNILTINKAIVQDETNSWISKTTKTTDSTRTVPIRADLGDFIRKQGYIYNGAPQSISNYLKRTENELGIPEFSLHKLRHYFASQLLSNNVPMADVKVLGGWKDDAVLKEVYAHAMKSRTEQDKRKLMENLF